MPPHRDQLSFSSFSNFSCYQMAFQRTCGLGGCCSVAQSTGAAAGQPSSSAPTANRSFAGRNGEKRPPVCSKSSRYRGVEYLYRAHSLRSKPCSGWKRECMAREVRGTGCTESFFAFNDETGGARATAHDQYSQSGNSPFQFKRGVQRGTRKIKQNRKEAVLPLSRRGVDRRSTRPPEDIKWTMALALSPKLGRPLRIAIADLGGSR